MALTLPTRGFDAGSGYPPVPLQQKDTNEKDAKTGKDRKQRVEYDRIQTEGINADITTQADLTKANRLQENRSLSFISDMKKGKLNYHQGMRIVSFLLLATRTVDLILMSCADWSTATISLGV